MSFKPAKSRSLVLKKGRVADRYRFAIGGTPIPTVTEKPVKSLGKVFNSSMRDFEALQQTKAELTSWLTAIDKSGLPGKFKAWMYQHGVLPRLLWPLLVYEVPMSMVEMLERNISQFLRRWLGLPRSLSSIALYGHSTMLQLPISGIVEEFKVTRARELMMYRDSTDRKVATAGIQVKTGRKWKAQEAVDRAEAKLQHNILVGNTAVGRAGLGCFPKPRYDKARGREKRQMVQNEIRAEVEEDRRVKMVAMHQQGAWTRWEHAEQRKVTWPELWRLEPLHIKFLIQSVYDVLPSPTNLKCWGLADTAACQLCQKRATLEHILSCCPKALGEGRYRWRHDQVLRALADTLSLAISNCRYQHTPKHTITFVRAGEMAQHQTGSSGGLLTTARDWKINVDLGRQLKFPEYITATSLRPDMVLISESTKQVVLVELTVPWEDRMEEANERKRAKYAELVSPWAVKRLISWARMSFKPAKSRSLVLKKGRVADRYRFAIGGTPIPTVTEKPVKSLGKVFNSSMRDFEALQQTKAELTSWLTAIDKSGLPGKFKAWMYQHGVLPRLLWPLLVYEVPMSMVEMLERNISQFLRRWLGLPRSLSSIALYGHSTMLQLPISGIVEEFKVTRARELMMYRDSTDRKVATAGIQVKTGRKWKAQEAVDRAEAKLQHNILVGNTAVGRAGLGCFPKPRYDKARGREKRQMVQNEIRAEVEEDRRVKMVAMHQQGAWTRWEHAEQRKVTWPELWRLEPLHIKFLIQSVYDVLPSPTNLKCWGLADTAACQLCQKRATLEHILSCCPKALGEGRYRWRHDQVLRALADTLSLAISNCRYQHTPKHTITFVRAGEMAQHQTGSSGGLLTTARDWKINVDLGRQLKFPEYITATALRPDMVLISESTKQVVLVELTVPWEDRMEEANERKRAKYAELVSECRSKGWKARCEPVEVGCRGFAGQSLPRTLKVLGIKGQLCRRAIRNSIEAAEKASRWLWIRRGDPWSSGPLGHKLGADHPRRGRPSEGV
ncbi:uncharacterized protein LOC143489330 [Brachyhypopomus gauderio]|uniref:uncharacterized protein LOC143489330 n=1 Tax=Brachyhypopomus gauderio TaxID=698409 RepID=UPI004042A494